MSWNPSVDFHSYSFYIYSGISLIFTFFIILVLIRIYNYCTLKMCYSRTNLKGKTVLITGANSGIGKETAKNMAEREARVIMACRDIIKAEKVKEEIIASTKNKNIIVHQVDLSSMKSVRAFADLINKTESRLDILIHNAGVANSFSRKVTEEGLEITMATNQFGPFLLSHLLIGLLKKSKPSRIVIVASELYRLARINLNNPNPINVLPAYLYYVSKYANILFTLELARRLEGTGVTANCLHPGLIDTGIWRNVPFPLNLPLQLIVKMCFKTPLEGAQTTIFCAVSQHLQVTSGRYFAECQESSLSAAIQDKALAKKYWEICEKMVQLKSTDPHL